MLCFGSSWEELEGEGKSDQAVESWASGPALGGAGEHPSALDVNMCTWDLLDSPNRETE